MPKILPHIGLDGFLNTHKGATIWIFGKGPSLDRYLESADYRSLDPAAVTIAVNETVLAVKSPTYFFASEYVVINRTLRPQMIFSNGKKIDPRLSRKFPDGTIVILPECDYGLANVDGIWMDRAFCYVREPKDRNLLTCKPEDLAKTHSLFSDGTSISSACNFARLVGAGSVVLVGVDGGIGIAEVFKNVHTRQTPIDYSEFRGLLLHYLREMQMPFRIWGE